MTDGATRTAASRWRIHRGSRFSRSIFVISMAGAVILLVALPQQTPGPVALTLLGTVWLVLALALTLPSSAERAHEDVARRLARFRHAVNGVGDRPTRSQLTGVLTIAKDLDLPATEIADDVARVEASLAALALTEDIAAGRMPIVMAGTPSSDSSVCHFQGDVRLGRRRSDHRGQLAMTGDWLTFRGPSDVSVAWTEVTRVQRAGADLILSLTDRGRSLRFACESFDQAARAGVIAEHLRQTAATTDAVRCRVRG